MSDWAHTSSKVPLDASNGRSFIEPDFRAPLDVAAVIAQVPEEAQVCGLFFLALLARAKDLNVVLPGARERYLPFNFYPLRELIPMMFEGTKHFYRSASLREGLRTLGRAVPNALIASTLGKVMLGSAEGIHAAAEAMAKTYAINLRPASRAELTQSGPNWLIVRLDGVSYLLDSHHVGIFEGVMALAGVEGRVSIALLSPSAAELLLSW